MATKKGRKWSAAQRAKFASTVAAKSSQQAEPLSGTVTSIPLSAVPDRPARVVRAVRSSPVRVGVVDPSRLQVVLEVVRLLRALLGN